MFPLSLNLNLLGGSYGPLDILFLNMMGWATRQFVYNCQCLKIHIGFINMISSLSLSFSLFLYYFSFFFSFLLS